MGDLPPFLPPLAVVLALALAMPGCIGPATVGKPAPDGTVPDGDGATAAPAHSVMLHVRLDNDVYAFVPERSVVQPGASIVLGHIAREHSLVLDGWFNATGGPDAWPEVVAPAEPGEYRFHCWLHATNATLPGQGMAGWLVVAG